MAYMITSEVCLILCVIFVDAQLHGIRFSQSVTWSMWSTWGSCETKTGCGKGEQKRRRIVMINHCLKDYDEQIRYCKLKSCPGIIHKLYFVLALLYSVTAEHFILPKTVPYCTFILNPLHLTNCDKTKCSWW